MKRGFTLVEIIVALMIFSVVAVVALAAMVKIIDANKKAQTIQDAVTNLSFSMDSMYRDLLTGSKYVCNTGTTPPSQYDGRNSGANFLSNMNLGLCAGGVNGGTGVTISFLSDKIDPSEPTHTCFLVYSYQIFPSSGTWLVNKAEQSSCNTPINSTDYYSVIAPNVSISSYYLKMGFPPTSGAKFPLAYIQLSGSVGTREQAKTYYSLQTAVSPRVP